MDDDHDDQTDQPAGKRPTPAVITIVSKFMDVICTLQGTSVDQFRIAAAWKAVLRTMSRSSSFTMVSLSVRGSSWDTT